MAQTKVAVGLTPEKLTTIDFKDLIGSPITAAVGAQLEAAMATISFINNVGFKNKGKDVRYVSLSYSKMAPTGMLTKTHLRVPMLTLFSIPCMRINELTIDFMAKVTDQVTYSSDQLLLGSMIDSKMKTQSGSDADAQDDTVWPESRIGPISSMNVDQKQDKNGYTVTKEFSYEVKVKCVSDDIPHGMERIYQALTSAIQTQNAIAGKMSQQNMKLPAMGGMEGLGIPKM